MKVGKFEACRIARVAKGYLPAENFGKRFCLHVQRRGNENECVMSGLRKVSSGDLWVWLCHLKYPFLSMFLLSLTVVLLLVFSALLPCSAVFAMLRNDLL